MSQTSGNGQDRLSIVVLGGINMDLVAYAPRFPQDGESVAGSRFLTYPEGKGANQAVAASRMGAQVRMIGRVGGDAFGPQLRDSLAADGVEVSGVAQDPEASSGIASIAMTPRSRTASSRSRGPMGTADLMR